MKLTAKFVRGYLLGAIGAAAYGLNPLFTLPLYADGLDAGSVLLLRYMLSVPVIGIPLLILRGRPGLRIDLRQGVILFVMGTLIALSSLALFDSYHYMDAGVASTLLFVYPVMVAVIMAACYREKLPLSTWVCIFGALGGIALLGKTASGETLSAVGALLVMVSSLLYALYIVLVNRSRLNDMPPLTVIFYVLLFGSVTLLLNLCFTGSVRLPSQPWLWSDVAGLAIFPTAISFGATTAAIQVIGATRTAILGALEPLTAVVIGVMVFGEQLTARICMGILLILVSVSFVVAAPMLRHGPRRD